MLSDAYLNCCMLQKRKLRSGDAVGRSVDDRKKLTQSVDANMNKPEAVQAAEDIRPARASIGNGEAFRVTCLLCTTFKVSTCLEHLCCRQASCSYTLQLPYLFCNKDTRRGRHAKEVGDFGDPQREIHDKIHLAGLYFSIMVPHPVARVLAVGCGALRQRPRPRAGGAQEDQLLEGAEAHAALA